MITPFRILIAFALQNVIAAAAPVGICLHAYSPEAPAEKIECFEFEKVERAGADYRFFPSSSRSVVVTTYRFRGTIPYSPDLSPTHPDFAKLLKLYEETARATPATRPYLNPKILAMRGQAAGVAKQAESVAALPTITLNDGSKLVGCTMSKIEDGFVSVIHQDGISKVSLKELDATEKKALNSTTEEWSLDDSSATSKDSAGTFAKIVFKNGRLLKKAKFKDVANGNLVFMADGKSVSVPVDQFPGELSVLGVDAVAALVKPEKEAVATRPAASSPDGEISPANIVSGVEELDDSEAQIKKHAEALAKAQAEGRPPFDRYPNEGNIIVEGLYIGMSQEAAMKQIKNIFGDDVELRRSEKLHKGHLETTFFRVPTFPDRGDCLINIDTRTKRLSGFSISGAHLLLVFNIKELSIEVEDFKKNVLPSYGRFDLKYNKSESSEEFDVYTCLDKGVKISIAEIRQVRTHEGGVQRVRWGLTNFSIDKVE